MSAIASTSPGDLAGNRLFAAIDYLTLIPIPREWAGPLSFAGRAATFFPLVGAGIGALGAEFYAQLSASVPPWIAALLIAAPWTLLTGTLRETGRALHGSPRTTLSLMAILFLRWQGLLALGSEVGAPLFYAILATQTIPRAGLVALAWTARPCSGMGLIASGGTGIALSVNLGSRSAVFAIAQGLLVAFLAGGILLFSLAAIAGYFTIRLLCTWSYAWRGGADGDVYGFAELILEAFLWALVIGGLI